MRGISTILRPDHLAAAMAPVAEHCAALDWAVDLYSGPLANYRDYDEDNPGNLLSFHHTDNALPNGYFRRGFLPRYADRLVFDEFSYYLGFDSTRLSPDDIARRLGAGWGLQPRRELFSLVAEHGLLYLLRVDGGWWEAYTPNSALAQRLLEAWCGTWVDAATWTRERSPP